FKRTPWVMEIRDRWPESIKAVGAIETSRVIKVLDRLVNFLYHRADRLVVVTDAFKKRMETLGVPPEKVKVVKNGVHIHQYQGVTRNEDLVKQYGLDGKFVVAYIGTHGMAHKLDFILDSAQHVKEKDIHFLFIGDGAFKSRLLKQLAALKLSNVTMLAPIPKSEVPEHIALADVALINLRKQKTFEKVLPSKIFENAAMGKPILLGVNGEARALVEHYGAGLYYEPENQADFLAQLTKLYQQRNNFAPYQAACLQLAQDFDRKRLAVNMFHILVDLHTEARPTTEPVPNMRLTDPIATYSTTPTVDTENQEPLNEHEVAE
ncbi:MAG: glycosyltransferase family 4 protein, partial [Bacteroidota bacterium]